MKRKPLSPLLFLVVFLLFLIISGCQPKEPKETVDYLEETRVEFDQRMQWWRDARFGMFIHWGAYAVPAGIYKGEEVPGIGEWIMDRANIPVEEYEKFVHAFNPVKFDAKEWVCIAKNAGMKYMVITSKHHDGFCLWDSQISDFDIIDAAPYGKDILKELSKECEKAGIKFCFYHSIMDWHHPLAKGDSFPDYRENYLKPQLKELLTGYGDIGVLWFDGEWINEWTEEQGKDLYNYVRDLQPNILINNRVGKGRQGMQGMNKEGDHTGDFGTPEQEILESSSDFDWESCMTMNDTWGFKKNDHNWKSAEMLIHNLVDITAKGGNYLLNVGPDAEGLIPAPSVERLAEMGKWLELNNEAIYGTRRFKEYKEQEIIRYTQKKENIYAVLLEWPGEAITLKYVKPGEGSEIELLGFDGRLDWKWEEEKGVTVFLPEEWQQEENRAGKYAWTLKIKVK